MTYFLDFDGVIVDSIDECYQVSFSAYFNDRSLDVDEHEYRKLFYMHRGLVKPPWEYSVLHKSIEICFENNDLSVESIFSNLVDKMSLGEREKFEVRFFAERRSFLDKNFDYWVSLNPLTVFGEKLVGKKNQDIFVVTTKNFEATSLLLRHNNIRVDRIFSNQDVKIAGSKGNLINDLMIEYRINDAIFIDDATEHLMSVNNPKVKCYFADWGYGKNENNHEVYNIDSWDK